MSRRTPLRSRRLAWVIALLLAGLFAGQGHGTRAEPRDPALDAFLAMGGSLLDLCGAAEGLPDGASGALHCEACRIAVGSATPLTGLAHRTRRVTSVDRSGADVDWRGWRARLAWAQAPRAPPAFAL